jgi:hypothetical protein
VCAAGRHSSNFWDAWNVDQMGKDSGSYIETTRLMRNSQIDTSNITNAFVSGMKEDLGLYHNEYNYIVVSWTVGYIIGQLVCGFFMSL